MKIIIKKSFSNGSVKETEIIKNNRDKLSIGEQMEIAVKWVMTRGIKCQLIPQHH
ncbi:MAG: hypothetical protein WC856_02255 [Methylococcaceae bacterium]|jgi:hypothetical protein